MKALLVLLVVFVSMSVLSQNTDSLVERVKQTDLSSLREAEEHRAFLENVFQVDQGIRNDVTRIEQNYGRNSVEYDSIFVVWIGTDRFLFKKIISYLEIHPHPTKELGEIACMTPQLVFHHLSGTPYDIEQKLKFLPVFYEAYLREDLKAPTIWFYLYRSYQEVFGNEIHFASDIGETEQIETMYFALMKDKK